MTARWPAYLAETVAQRQAKARSAQAARVFADLMALPPDVRRGFIRGLSAAELTDVVAASTDHGGSPYALWVDDPVGFVEDVLGENVWSKARALLASIPAHTRTAVPSCFSSSKTWSISRSVLWWSAVHPVGTAKAVTVAPKWDQVVRLVWPEIRSAHKRSGMPGNVDMAQMKMHTAEGLETVVAYGVAANPNAEASVQGIHAPHLLVVVDEAGGIGHGIGRNLRSLLTGDDSRMVAIGNPPTDDEGSWFEQLCGTDGVNVVRIDAPSTPNFTGEQVGRCRSCPRTVPAHPLSRHLVDQAWVAETITEYGEDAPYVQAKVHARFPRGGSERILPVSWLEAAVEVDDPTGPGWRRLDALDVGESDPWTVQDGAWVRLGVDVASDGGDEFVIARLVGDLATIRHSSSGAANTNPTDVAGVVLREILQAQRVAAALGTRAPVRVKVDANGVGWGVAGILEAWASEGLHDAQIVRVMVSESTGRVPDPSSAFRPWRKRDEMWTAFRELLQPSEPGGAGRLRLRVDRKTIAQFAAPKYGTNASGFTVIESKKSLKARGLASPDRAESLLMCAAEPVITKPGVGVRLIA